MANREELLRELDVATRAGDMELAQIIDKELDALPSAAQQRMDAMPPFARATTAVGEAGLQALTGLGSSVAGGIAGLVDLGLSSAGIGSGAPGDTVRKVQEFGTYQPRTAQGQRASSVLAFPFDLYTKAVRAGGDAIRGDSAGGVRDFLGTTFDVAGEAAPAVVGGVAALRSAAKAPKAPLTQEQQALAAAQKEGYTVPPSLTGNRSWLESAGGKARTAQVHSAKNTEVTTKIAARELGFPDGVELTPDLLNKTRKRVYDEGYVPLKQRQNPLIADEQYMNEIVSLPARADEIRASFPDAKIAGSRSVEDLAVGQLQQQMTYSAAVERIRQLRFEADKNFKAYDNPNKAALAHAQKSAANSLESLIERSLAQTGDQAALTKFREARQYIAKSHTVEDAMNPVTGVVHARDLAKSDAPLTGGLKTSSDFAKAFPKAVQKPETFGGTPSHSPLDMSMAQAMATAGAIGTGSPAGLLTGGLPILRPYAAPITRAPFVQNSLIRTKQPLPPEIGLLPLLTENDRRRLR